MIQRILIILTLILLLPDLYIYRMFISRLLVNHYIKAIYWLPTLLLVVSIVYLAFFAGSEFISQHMRWVGWLAIVVFLFAIPKLLFMICSLIGLPFNYWLHWPSAPFVYTGLLLAGVNAGVILYGAFIGKTHFEVKQASFTSARLPKAFDGYRIVQLSDIHIGSWAGNAKALQRMVDMVNAQQPDLIVFTGDLINNRAIELDGFQQILSTLHAKDGIYSILGNHDYGPYYPWKSKRAQADNLTELKKREAAMGWKLLSNEHVILYRNTDSIALIGVENDGEPPFSQYANLPKAVAGTEELFQLLLSHNPTHWHREVLPTSKVDLMLAGHTHAMQLAIGHHSPSSLIYPQWSGMYQQNERGLYVNVGLGFVGLPFRFGAWPEITVITLKH